MDAAAHEHSSDGREANKALHETSSTGTRPMYSNGGGDGGGGGALPRHPEDVTPANHAGAAAQKGEVNGGGSDRTNNDDDDERQKLLQESLDLERRILSVERRRAEIRRASSEMARRRNDLLRRRNRAERDRADALARYRSATSGRAAAEAALESLRKLDVTNDCFHIWHRGPFGTINGLRLGSEVPPPPSGAVSDEELAGRVGGGGRNGTGPLEASGAGAFDLSSMMWGAASLFSDQGASGGGDGGGTSGSAGTPRAAGYDPYKVPLSETNAALGMAALLLSTLQQKPNSGIKFTTHELTPLGSFSKVGVLQPDGRPSVQYNLFYADDSFNFFGRRNFNAALDGLFRCLKDAADAAVRIDRTLTLPHEVTISSRGEVTIGGLPIAYGTDNGEAWTRAMKYFLTDLKWLVAFATKNIDR